MTIQMQALKIELGDSFDEFYARTTSYVKGLIGKPWWKSTKQLLTNEGPLGRMVEHCLVYVVEEGDRIEGYRAYTAWLAKEYGTTAAHNSHRVALAYASEIVAQAPLEALAHNERALAGMREFMNAEEIDFMDLVGNIKAREAAEMLDLSIDDVWNKYRRLRKRADIRREELLS